MVEIERLRSETEKYRFDQELKLKQELENKRLDQEFELKKLELEFQSKKGPVVKSDNSKESLPVMRENDDIQIYLDTCDKIVCTFGRSSGIAAQKLSQSIRGKARTSFSRMSTEDIKDYEAIKQAILRGYDLTAEALRKKFRVAKRESGETHREWLVRLSSGLDKWLNAENVKTVDELKELMVKEHFITNVSPELQGKLKELDFKTAKEIAEFGDRYGNAHGFKTTVLRKVDFHLVQEPDAFHCSKFPESSEDEETTVEQYKVAGNERKSVMVCTFCSGVGHIEKFCYKKNGKR